MATKDKAKDKEPRLALSYLPVRQEQPFDSDSEGASATIASVRKHLPQRTTCNTRNSDWNIYQLAN